MKKTLLLSTFLIVTILLFYFVYFPVISKQQSLKEEERRIAAKIEDLDGKIKTLLDERHQLENDVAYLEKVIRDELGLVRPGEVVYKVVKEVAPAKETSFEEVLPATQ